jgi:[ribosomal protein S5]-alanine N-acetyltransferase
MSAPPERAERPVYLRAPRAEDCEAFIAAMRASRALHQPWVTPPLTFTQYEAWLERSREQAFDPLLACRVEDGAIVGFLNLSNIVRGAFQNAFVGYGGVATYAGQGYMTAALRLTLARAFTELRLHRVEANIQPGNAASLALARRCGFVREGFSERYLKVGGRWRDHERWAIRREQWLAVRLG